MHALHTNKVLQLTGIARERQLPVRSKVESWDDYQDWAEEETEAQHAEEEASKVRLSLPQCLCWYSLCRYGYLKLSSSVMEE
jgi:hypothetical protein